ncbi:hypothetical protein FB446DRAFT_705330 [Lentinula raphanica]|nr:hypothetical protein FB446DRAFT_705330 [Lentinula raphanica]
MTHLALRVFCIFAVVCSGSAMPTLLPRSSSAGALSGSSSTEPVPGRDSFGDPQATAVPCSVLGSVDYIHECSWSSSSANVISISRRRLHARMEPEVAKHRRIQATIDVFRHMVTYFALKGNAKNLREVMWNDVKGDMEKLLALRKEKKNETLTLADVPDRDKKSTKELRNWQREMLRKYSEDAEKELAEAKRSELIRLKYGGMPGIAKDGHGKPVADLGKWDINAFHKVLPLSALNALAKDLDKAKTTRNKAEGLE